MDNLHPRIEFYRQRSFSEKMNVVFEFIRENWKPLLKYSFYLIMPVCLIQTFAKNAFFGTYVNMLTKTSASNSIFLSNSMVGFFGHYGVWMLCSLIGSAILSGMIYAMMQTYAVRENKLQNITIDDFNDLLVKNTWKYIRLTLALLFMLILVSLLIGLLASITAWSLVITVPILLTVIMVLMLLVPVYIFERDITFFEAIGKAWILGYETFWGMLGLMIVLYLISFVIQTITSLPWNMMTIINTGLSVTSTSTMNQSAAFKFMQYIFGLLHSYGTYVSVIIGVIGLAFQYFHAREKIEGVTIESNISNFDNM